MRFGNLLRELRSAYGLSLKDYASRAGMDPTYVSYLQRALGERAGSARPPTLERLARGFGWAPGDDHWSLFMAATSRDERERPEEAAQTLMERVSQDLASSGGGWAPPLLAAGGGVGLPAQEAQDPIPVGGEEFGRPAVLVGATRLMAFLSRMVASAPALATPHEDSVLITHQAERDPLATVRDDAARSFSSRWTVALQALMRRGWDVHHLVRLGRDPQRGVPIVAQMLRMLSVDPAAGSYLPYRFALPGTGASDGAIADPLLPAYDLVLVPEVGAVLLLATQCREQVDTGFFYPADDVWYDRLRAHGDLLRAQCSGTPLLRAYPSISGEFEHALIRTESAAGERVLVKAGLSTNLEPLDVFRERVEAVKEKIGRAMAEELLRSREARQRHWLLNIGHHRCRDICAKRSIEEMVTTGQPSADDSLRLLSGSNLTPQQVAATLRWVIRQLEDNPNYELAILEDDEATHYRVLRSALDEPAWTWEATSTTLLVETWNNAPDSGLGAAGRWVNVEISEPALAASFRSYFDRMWAAVPQERKSRDAVRSWLQEQVARCAARG